MKRVLSCSVLLLLAAVFVPVLRADVKTVQRSTFKLEGLMGAMLNRAAGGDAGQTTTMAIKGTRMSRVNDATGEIVDLTEEKVYRLDVKKKEYTVKTFAELRAEMEQARADAAKRQAQMNPQQPNSQEPAKQSEFEVTSKQTGQTKAIAGYDTHEVIVTVTMHEKGRKLEDGGGTVMTNTMWVAPRVAAFEEAIDFNAKYFKAVYGGAYTGMDMAQMNALSAMLPGIGTLAERMSVEGRKLQGTPLATTTVMETVKSAEQMAGAPRGGDAGGGIGGMLARRMARGQTEQRSTTLTTTMETQSIATAVSAADVAVPAGFKEKK